MMVTAAMLLLGATATAATSVSYDAGYDDASRSLTVISCSDGANGLITKYGWQTQGQITNSPYIGGWDRIAGWNSAQCGQCLSATYNGKTINILAIDHTETGLNIAKAAMNELTNGNAGQVGRVDAEVKVVDMINCGLVPKKKGAEFMA